MAQDLNTQETSSLTILKHYGLISRGYLKKYAKFIFPPLLFLIILLTYNSPAKLLKHGDRFYEQQNYSLAFSSYKAASEKTPFSPLPHLKLSQVAQRINNWDMAERELLLAVDLYHNNAFVEAELERIRGIKQQPEIIRERIGELEKIVGEKKDYRDIYLQLSYYYYQLYEDQKAQEALNAALSLDPNYPASLKLKEIILP